MCDHEIAQAKQFLWDKFLAFLHEQKSATQHLTIFYKAVMSVNFNCNVWSVKYVWNFFFWSINYSNLVYKVCITFWKCQDTQTLFMLQVLIYRKTYFNSLLLFSYICWSVNCMSWISKFNNFFLKCTETEARFIFVGFKHCPLWKIYFQYFYTFLVFLYGL